MEAQKYADSQLGFLLRTLTLWNYHQKQALVEPVGNAVVVEVEVDPHYPP